MPRKKAVKPPIDINKELSEALAVKPSREKEGLQSRPVRMPRIGERVMRLGSDSQYEITSVSSDGSRVNIGIPRTNFEWRNLDAATLTYLDAPLPEARGSSKPKLNVEEIRERIENAQHSSMAQLNGDIAILKKYLKSKGVPDSAAEDLDSVCKQHEKAWNEAVAKIKELMEE